jgi:hypothetical protein
MDTSSSNQSGQRPSGDPGRFDLAIGLLAIALYVVERCAAFFFLLRRAGAGGGVEAELLGFFFGREPYSILDILVGFDSYAGWFGLPIPRNILQVLLQGLHFLANVWIAGLPFAVYRKRSNRPRE